MMAKEDCGALFVCLLGEGVVCIYISVKLEGNKKKGIEISIISIDYIIISSNPLVFPLFVDFLQKMV